MAHPITTKQQSWPIGDGAMCGRVRDHDWTSTALGPLSEWPRWWRTSVDIVLRVPSPALLTLGGAGSLLYNDACCSIVEAEVGSVLGQGAKTWSDNSELAKYLDPLVPELDVTVRQRLSVNDHATGARTKQYFDVHYFGIVDDDNAPSAVLVMLHDVAPRMTMSSSDTRRLRRVAANRAELVAVEELERRRLSRELHDQLGQHVTAISLALREIRNLSDLPPAHRARIAEVEELAVQLTRDMRHLAIQLRPPELDDLGLGSAIETYVEQWTQRYGIPVDVQVDQLARLASDGVATAVYRLLQEALTNVAKHAKARQVSVVAQFINGEVKLVVEDDGDGFDVEQTTRTATRTHRLGLSGMRERAELAGGTLAIESSRGRGVTIVARIPVH